MSSEEEMAVLMYARNAAEARYYQDILEDYGINVYVEDDTEAAEEGDGVGKGIAIMVPLEDLEEAQVAIEQRSSFSDGLEDDLDFYNNDSFDTDDLDDLTEIEDDNPNIM